MIKIPFNLVKLTALVLVFGLAGCDGEPSQEQEDTAAKEMTTKQSKPVEKDDGAEKGTEAAPEASDERVVTVVARDFTIEAPDRMDTGWHTMRLENKGEQVHFVLMYRLVEGKTIEDQQREVVPAFDQLMEGIRNGEIKKEEIGAFLGENIPDWGLQMTYVGGAGLLAPGRTTHTTFRIPEPGTYLMECYVKAPDGTWHTSMGMLTQTEVVDEGGAGTEPEADAALALTNAGIEAPDTLPAGRQTIRVDFKEDPETFTPYDVNLAKIDESTNLDDVVFWMDWSNVGGLRAPAPVEFLGGVEHMEAGNHGYMTVDLSPGRYLWISEVNAGKMHKTFMVE